MGVSKPKLNCKYIREVAADKLEQPGPMVDNDDEQDSFTKILTLYPDYNKLFIQTQTILMSGDGSLPINYRHFIAVLALRYLETSPLLDDELTKSVSCIADQLNVLQ